MEKLDLKQCVNRIKTNSIEYHILERYRIIPFTFKNFQKHLTTFTDSSTTQTSTHISQKLENEPRSDLPKNYYFRPFDILCIGGKETIVFRENLRTQ